MSPFAGADIITFFAPALMCLLAPNSSLNTPVHSKTTSTSSLPQGNSSGSFLEKTLISLPLTIILSSFASTVPSKTPYAESYLNKCASVFVSVKSLIATKSTSKLFLIADLSVHLPILPKPLIAIFILIFYF